MTKREQIKEIAEAIFQNCNCGLFFSEAEKIAKFVIEEQGYRKRSEVAKKIFKELEKLTYRLLNDADYTIGDIVYDITELKNKYTGEK